MDNLHSFFLKLARQFVGHHCSIWVHWGNFLWRIRRGL